MAASLGFGDFLFALEAGDFVGRGFALVSHRDLAAGKGLELVIVVVVLGLGARSGKTLVFGFLLRLGKAKLLGLSECFLPIGTRLHKFVVHI